MSSSDPGRASALAEAVGERWPRITIVTPSYNQGQYLEETIRSVILQGYPNLEYIVMDGGSTDESVDVIRQYDASIAHWVSEKDRGQAHAINKGFALATGQILGYLNSDDLLTEGTLQRVADAFRDALEQPLLVNFSGTVFGDHMEDVVCAPPIEPRLDDWLSSLDSLFQPSTFWTSVLHRRLGGFKENMQFCFDKEFFLRAIFKVGRFEARPEWVASRFRMHAQAKTSTISEVMWAENRALWTAYGKNDAWSQARLDDALRSEQSAMKARKAIALALHAPHTFESARLLVAAAITSPREAGTRPYLGAWRRVLMRAFDRTRAK